MPPSCEALTPVPHNLIRLGNVANGDRISAIRYEARSVQPA